MGILKIVFKNRNSQSFMSKIVKNWEFPFFVLKMIEYFGNSHVVFTLATKKVLNFFLDFPMKNVVKIFGIPMSSLGGVHLISGIALYKTCSYKMSDILPRRYGLLNTSKISRKRVPNKILPFKPHFYGAFVTFWYNI